MGAGPDDPADHDHEVTNPGFPGALTILAVPLLVAGGVLFVTLTAVGVFVGSALIVAGVKLLLRAREARRRLARGEDGE